jgi:proline iminopeptidase
MDGVANELSKKYRCVMLEQRGTGRSKLSKYDSSTINLKAYIGDIEALRRQLQIDKLIPVGNSWGMMLALAYGGTYPDHARAIVTIGSGPITTEYFSVMVENVNTRLSPSDKEVIQYWTEPSRRAANFERAEFERVRATAPAYFTIARLVSSTGWNSHQMSLIHTSYLRSKRVERLTCARC